MRFVNDGIKGRTVGYIEMGVAEVGEPMVLACDIMSPIASS